MGRKKIFYLFSFFSFFTFFIPTLFLWKDGLQASIDRGSREFSTSPELSKRVHYQTSFGNCPTRGVGHLTLDLVQEFEKNHSLFDLKKKILAENLQKKHFLSSYQIKYDPVSDYLHFSFKCPVPLMRVQLYKDFMQESFNAILGNNGEIYDPTYEILMKNEKKLHVDLPYLALPEENENSAQLQQITQLMNDLSYEMRKKVSEIILSEDRKLTVLLTFDGYPLSVFFGEDEWFEKMKKLSKIIKYMESKKKTPSVINLTNSKKVVVKFSDNF